MTKAMYVTLKGAIEDVVQSAKPLEHDPNGRNYYRGSRSWNKYLVGLGVLGPAARIYSVDRQKYSPVNYKRAEEVLEKLRGLEQKVGVEKIRRVRIDLEQLR